MKKLLFVFLLVTGQWSLVTANAATDFQTAAQLLTAAKNADIARVQELTNAGADINYVDNTGLSLVCTAVMNNDMRAAQILQMYGADASKCDVQIKRYSQKKATPQKTAAGGGIFSGLSSAQGMALAAAGAAVVIGGVVWLAGSFGSDNDNGNGSGGGGSRQCQQAGAECACGNGTIGVCGTDGRCGQCGSGGGNGEIAFGIPYGPLLPNAASEAANYITNLDGWNPDNVSGDEPGDPATNTLRSNDFAAMSQNGNINYLLIMRGYSPLARGYLGQNTFRNAARAPEEILNDTSGGKPIGVALITENGVDASGSAGHGNITYADSAAVNANTFTVDKYLNYQKNGDTWSENTDFDLSGHGTVYNSDSTETDLAKIVGGWEAGGRDASVGDLYGFIPNGQLAIYRTGGGFVLGGEIGSVDIAGNSITVDGTTYNDLSVDTDTGTFAYNGGAVTGVISGNIWTIDGGASYEVFDDNSLYELTPSAYKNWTAMKLARPTGVSVIANTALVPTMRSLDTLTVAGMRALGGSDKDVFAQQINRYYGNGTGDTSQGTDALSLLNAVGTDSPIIVMSAGEFLFGTTPGANVDIQEATFENYAPMLFPNLEHMFMTVVAVAPQGGTGAISSISGYTGTEGKLSLGYTYVDTDVVAASRICGRTAGMGAGGIDPWCFAAAGNTGAAATAAAAGAFGALKGAFNYMSNAQLFALMALTADGYMLGTNPTTGLGWANEQDLVTYLQERYSLPAEYQNRVTDGEDYLDVFAQVFGYGLINLERATTPGKNIYYYNGNDIVSDSGDAYWRAASRSRFGLSGAFGSRRDVIKFSLYDILQSADGETSLPRVWENKFDLSAGSHGLYMGDVLGEFAVSRRSSVAGRQGFQFNMKTSDRAYADYMGGLDNMRFGYNTDAFSFGAEYQSHLTDGAARFDGLANPILSLASNAVGADAKYKSGKWQFGGRAFSGAITDAALLENDPVVSSQYMPLKLGDISGAETNVAWADEKFSFTASVGTVAESDTVLGAVTDGLLDLGGGNTTYVDAVAKYNFGADASVTLRGTLAHTTSDATGEFIMGLTDITSNAFSAGIDIGGFSFAAAMPLGVTRGHMQYAGADYEVVTDADGNFNLDITNMGVRDLDLTPAAREVRFSGAYRHKLGEFTDGALGFIYRINPDHTDEFGNEGILMMKVSHRLGI